MFRSTSTNAKCNAKGSRNRSWSRDSTWSRWVLNIFPCFLTCILIKCTGVRPTWKRLIDGQCGIVNIKERNPKFATLPSQVAGVIPVGLRADGGWTSKEWLQPGVSSANFPHCRRQIEHETRMTEKWRCLRNLLWLQRKKPYKTQIGDPSQRKIFKQP